jgi:hypothetical protein
LTAFGAAVVLPAVFIALQDRGRNPLLPLQFLANRSRSGA